MKSFSPKLFFNTLIILICFLFVFTSCTDDKESSQGTLALAIKTNDNFNIMSISTRSPMSEVAISDFKMNLKEFELELDVESDENQIGDDDYDWNDDGHFDYFDEVELEGPFELDLMGGQITFLNVSLPNGVYEEIEFKFHKGTDSSSELFDKTILLKGTIDGVPFLFWDDFWEEIECDFEDPQIDIHVQNDLHSITIFFDLQSVLNPTIGVDLSEAVDGNNDGLIEIYHNDPDGNSDLAQELRNMIRENIDLIDD